MTPREHHRSTTERLTREDAARWHMGTPENPMVIGVLLMFERAVSVEELQGVMRDKLVPHRRFRQHVVEPRRWFERPRWRDDAVFDVSQHVRRIASGVAPGELNRLVSERMSTPLPAERSPWLMELIELTSGRTAVIARFHHVIADGRALVSLLEELADAPAGAASAPRASRPARRGHAALAGLLASVTSALRFFALSLTPRRRWPRGAGPLTGRKRVAWSAEIPMETVKALAHATDHHVANVLLAAVAGAIERSARLHGRTPRALQSLLPVAAPAGAAGALGNHFASVFVRLPIARVDAPSRLETISREMEGVRGGGALRAGLALMRLAGAATPALERWAVRWWARCATLVVSSLPGPAAPVQLAGRRLVSTVVWAPAPASIGLSVTFFGYAGALHVGVLTDEGLGVGPDELVASFRDALDELGRGVRARSP